jgi:hypothetical protein
MAISRKFLFRRVAGGLMMNIIEKKIYVDGVTDQHLEKFKEKERR